MATIKLKVVHGQLKGRIFEFSRPECVLLGRVSDALICLPDDPFISRHHLLMEMCPPLMRLSDLGSKNGFFVNDQHYGGGGETLPNEPLDPSAPHSAFVSEDDLIVVGTNRFHVSVSEEHRARSSALTTDAEESGVFPIEGMIGPYQIKREIGQGWMGDVHEAVSTRSGEMVALKMMIPTVFSGDGTEVFQKELYRLQNLDHPCISRLKDFFPSGNGFYCVQSFNDGTDLSRLLKLRGGKLDLAEAAPIMLDILDGLAHAHANGGFVHRNLKPRNILIRGKGRDMRATVADFGLFRALEIAGLNQTIQSKLYFDAPCYWPRERITFFNRTDGASDVFSAAAIFYQMLTGCLVRDGLFELQSRADQQDRPPGLADYLTLMAANPPIPIRTREPGIPAGIAEIIDRALAEPIIRRGAEDPGATFSRARFPDAARFRAALLGVLPADVLSRTDPGTGG